MSFDLPDGARESSDSSERSLGFSPRRNTQRRGTCESSKFAAVEQIARAVLYEGFLLYPYRPSALKNRQRWMFGRVLPRDYSLAHAESEPWTIQTECLVEGTPRTALEIRVRFLQLGPCAEGSRDQPSEVSEREFAADVILDEIAGRPRRHEFAFPERREGERAGNGMHSVLLEGAVVLRAADVGDGLFKLTVAIENLTPCCAGELEFDQALSRSLISTHTILRVQGGRFISSLDPPEPYAAASETCRNVGAWPVLVGPEPGNMVISAPIILYDYPEIAPESPGDLFDGTEIDEILTLRIQTLTDQERCELMAEGGHASTLLKRTESLTHDELLQMHGRCCNASPVLSVDRNQAPRTGLPPNRDFRPGDRVRLRPRGRADAFDVLLNGQTATVISVQHDFEDRVHLGVVIDEDPGKDFGVRGHPGHRFFFGPEDVETLAPPRILVAGIGNILFGDDAFGVEVVRKWCERPPRDGVRAVDFGIRGFDLACAIMDGYDAVILVDAISRGGRPGTLYLIEPDLESLAAQAEPVVEGHMMSPERVMQWVQALGGPVPPIRLVGCEPANLGSDDEPQMGLSSPVAEAVHQAVDMIQSLIDAECAKGTNP